MASTSWALCLLLLSLSVCQVVTARTLSADPTPRERIQQAFKEITTLSDNLRIETQNINLINAPLQGYKIAQGFSGIITKITEYNARLAPGGDGHKPSPLGDDDAKLVVKSLTTFVQVHQALLNVVIGKHGLLTLIPFFEPIRLTLVSLEATVDTFAFYLIDLIPTQKPAADQQFLSLTITVQLAISTYEEPIVNSGAVTDDAPLVQTINEAFKVITTLSDNLRVETQKINLINASLQGYKIAQGFSVIIEAVSETSVKLSGTSANGKLSPLGDDDAKLVVKSLTTFVQVHQALLNVVIGKHGLLTLIPFFEPIRQALVTLEAAVDTFAFYLIELIPTQKPAAEDQFGALDVTVQMAITTYKQPIVAAAVAANFLDQ